MLIFNSFLALNRENNKKDPFEVRSPIKAMITPHSGIIKSFTLTGYSSRLK